MSGPTTALLLAIGAVLVFFLFVYRPGADQPASSSHQSHVTRTQRAGVIEPVVSNLQSIDAVDAANLPLGLGYLAGKQAKQNADILQEKTRAAEAIHHRNMIIRAEALQVSVQALDAIAIEKFRTDEEIRKYLALKSVDVRLQRMLDRNKLLTERIDAKNWLELSEQVALLEQRLEALHGNGQKALPSPDTQEAGRADEAAEDE